MRQGGWRDLLSVQGSLIGDAEYQQDFSRRQFAGNDVQVEHAHDGFGLRVVETPWIVFEPPRRFAYCV